VVGAEWIHSRKGQRGWSGRGALSMGGKLVKSSSASTVARANGSNSSSSSNLAAAGGGGTLTGQGSRTSHGDAVDAAFGGAAGMDAAIRWVVGGAVWVELYNI